VKRAGKAGFTLIEIMVALVILSLALVVLMQGHYAAVTTLTISRDQVIMRNLVEQAIGFAEVGVYSNKLSDSKEYNKRFKGYKWSYEAQPMEDESNPLYSVKVRIDIPESDPVEFSFYTYRGDEYTPEGPATPPPP
jgi:type II secretion system protein I